MVLNHCYFPDLDNYTVVMQKKKRKREWYQIIQDWS